MRRQVLGFSFLAAALVLGLPGTARADVVDNNLTLSSKPAYSGNDLGIAHPSDTPPTGIGAYYEVVSVPAGGTATVNMELVDTSPTGCIASVGTPLVLTITRGVIGNATFLSDLTTVVGSTVVSSTTSPDTRASSASTVTFTACSTTVPLVVTGGSVVGQATTFNFAGTGCLAGSTCALTGRFVTVTVPSNTAPTVTISDVTPAISAGYVEGNATGGANVSWTTTATDTEDTPDPTATCSDGTDTVTSPTFFALGGPYTITCSATDTGGLPGSDDVTFTVRDTTAPSLGAHGDETATATSAAGAVVTYTNPTASDIVDSTPTVTCVPASGSTFAPGTTEVSCTATDDSLNTSAATTLDVTVTFGWAGFFQPIDNGGVFNSVKGGSTVPVKWTLAIPGGGYIDSIATVTSLTWKSITCPSASTALDDVEQTVATGGTVLRWDDTAKQFVYNWTTPKRPGTCVQLVLTLTDGTTHTANFKLK